MRGGKRNIVLVVAAVAACVIINVMIWALRGGQRLESTSHKPSTYYTDRHGSKAMRVLLESLGYDVYIVRRPYRFVLPEETPTPEYGAVLIVQGPEVPIERGDADALLSWIRAGGVVLLACDQWEIVSDAASQDDSGGELLAELGFETAPMYRSRRTDYGAASPAVFAGGSLLPGDYNVIVEDGRFVLAAGRTIGAGGVVVIPDALVFTNGRLRRSDNAVLLAQLLGETNPYFILIDEYHHGFSAQPSLLRLMTKFLTRTPWGWFILQVIAAGLLYLVATRRRFERVKPERPVRRERPLELVRAYAGLLRAAQARQLSVDTMKAWLSIQSNRTRGRPLGDASRDRADVDDSGALATLADRAAGGHDDFLAYSRGVGHFNQKLKAGRRDGKL